MVVGRRAQLHRTVSPRCFSGCQFPDTFADNSKTDTRKLEMRLKHLIAPALILLGGYFGLKTVVDAELSDAALVESGFDTGTVIAVENIESNSLATVGGKYARGDFGKTTHKFAILQVEVDNGDEVRISVPQKRFSRGDRIPLKVEHYEDGRRRYDYAPENY